MIDVETHRCHRGRACPDAQQDAAGARVGAPIAASSGLCRICERHVQRAIESAPADYVSLEVILGKGLAGAGERLSGTREKPVPLRLAVEELQADLFSELLFWVEPVAERLRVDWDTAAIARARRGHTLQRAAQLLASNVPVLLALRDAPDAVRSEALQCWVGIERHGLDGAVRLLDLHQRARHAVGLTRSVHRLAAPCPACERFALERADGSDRIDCTGCALVMSTTEYERSCLMLAHFHAQQAKAVA